MAAIRTRFQVREIGRILIAMPVETGALKDDVSGLDPSTCFSAPKSNVACRVTWGLALVRGRNCAAHFRAYGSAHGPRWRASAVRRRGNPDSVFCGSFDVLENPAAPTGPRIKFNVLVLPATGDSVARDALTFLAGGGVVPATRYARFLARAFAGLRRHHDIVLVDQRGTWNSAPLSCGELPNRSHADVDPCVMHLIEGFILNERMAANDTTCLASVRLRFASMAGPDDAEPPPGQRR